MLNVKIKQIRDLRGGPVDKTPPHNTRDTGSVPGQGAEIPYDTEHLSPLDAVKILCAATGTRGSQINRSHIITSWRHWHSGILSYLLRTGCFEGLEYILTIWLIKLEFIRISREWNSSVSTEKSVSVLVIDINIYRKTFKTARLHFSLA